MGDVEGDEAELLLGVVDDEGLVHEVDGAVGDELLQVVGEGLAAEVEAADPVVEGEVLEHGGGVGEGEAAVDDEAALGGARVGAPAGLVEVDEGGGIGDAESAEAEVLEDELVGGVLDGWGVEEGLHQEEGGAAGVDAEEGADHPVPHLLLEVRVDEIAPVEGAAEGHRRHVRVRGLQLVRHQPPLGGGGGGRGAAEAVGHHRRGVPVAAESGLAQPGAVVQDHHAGHRRRRQEWRRRLMA